MATESESQVRPTPGPWSLKFREYMFADGLHFEGVVGPDGQQIRVEGMTLSSGDVPRANARLIAAAPELLTALQKLFEAGMERALMGDGKDDQIEAIAKSRAAIARATGAVQS